MTPLTEPSAEPSLTGPSVPVRRLFVFRSVELGWIVFYALFMRALSLFDVRWSSLEHFDEAVQLIWLVFTAVNVGLLVGLRREFAAHPAAGLLRAALALEVVSLVASAVFAGAEIWSRETVHALGLSGSGVTAFFALVSVSFDFVFWLALERLSGRVDTWLRAAFFGLRLAALGVTAFSILAFESYRSLMFKAAFAFVLQWLRLAISVSWNAVVVAALYRLAQKAPAPASLGAAPTPPDGTTDLIMGAVWLGGGLLVTLGSYSAASGSAGGRYVVTTGAIAYGVIRLGRGLVRLGRR